MNAETPSSASRDDVERDEQPVVPRIIARARAPQSATTRFDLVAEPRRGRSARRGGGSRRRRIERSTASAIASAKASADGSSTSTPVSPSLTVSSAPPRPSATTGRPQACASSGTMPKSSSPGSSTAARAPIQLADVFVGDAGRGTRRRPPAMPLERARARGRRRRSSAARRPAAGVDGDVDALVGHQRGHDEREAARATAASGW